MKQPLSLRLMRLPEPTATEPQNRSGPPTNSREYTPYAVRRGYGLASGGSTFRVVAAEAKAPSESWVVARTCRAPVAPNVTRTWHPVVAERLSGGSTDQTVLAQSRFRFGSLMSPMTALTTNGSPSFGEPED